MLLPSEWPEIIDLSLTNFCNLRCVFCHSTVYDFGKPQSMPLELIYKLEPAFKYAKSVTLFNRFEPLVHPQFLQIFKYVSRFSGSMYFSTNGLNLTKELSLSLIERKLNYLTLSISTLNSVQYAKLYGKDVLPRVLDNLRTLVRKKKELKASLPRLRIMVVLMKNNLDQLPLIIELARELELEEGVAINFFISHRESLLSENPLAADNYEMVQMCLDNARILAQKIGVKLAVQAGSLEALNSDQLECIEKTGHKFCPEAFRRVSIDYNGDVKACSVAVEILGNLVQADIETIWHNDAFQNFRATVNTENPPQSCRNCWHCRQGAFQVGKGEYSVHRRNVMGVPKFDELEGKQ